jgi:hypothetical protein
MKNKELSISENIRKDLDVAKNYESFKVPMTYVFGTGSLANKESFGGLTFVENAKRVDAALKNTSELQDIWNHSHSQWSWKHINMTYHSVFKNMRQVAGELSSKRNVLNEAKWRHIEREVVIRKAQEELEKPELDYWREVELKIELAKNQEILLAETNAIEGAMKDILALNEVYEQLKNQLSEFSEEDIESAESKAHLKRSLVQCIRDVRQHGVISKGEQEYLEQIGVNPMKTQILLRQYVKEEAEIEEWSVSCLHEFVDKLTNELIDDHKVDIKKLEIQGLNPETIGSLTYDKKIGYKNKKE